MRQSTISLITQSVLAFLGVILLVVSIFSLVPGDPCRMVLGERANGDTCAAFIEQYGLNEPIPAQVIVYLRNMLQGDLGMSVRTRLPIADLLLQRLPATLELVGAAALITALLGSLLLAGHKKRAGLVVLLMRSVPVFWLALMLILIFSISWGVLPMIGRAAPSREGVPLVWERLEHLVLPVSSLVIFALGLLLWRMRPVKYDRHLGLRPIVSSLLGPLLGAVVLVETVFAWPGVGRLALDAAISRDYPLLAAIVVVLTGLIILAQIMLDLLMPATRSLATGKAPMRPRLRRPEKLTPVLQRLQPAERSSPVPDFQAALQHLASRSQSVATHYRSKHSPQTGVMLLGVMVIIAVLAPVFVEQVLQIDSLQSSLRERLMPVGTSGHPLGTDRFGRDILARLLVAAQTSLGISLIAGVIATTIGVAAGTIARNGDSVVGWAIGVLLRFLQVGPLLLLLMLLMTMIGPGADNLIVMLGLLGWSEVALDVQRRDRLDANVVLALFAANIAFFIVIVSALGFLGLGVQPPTPSWGNMLAESMQFLLQSSILPIFPGLMISASALFLYRVSVYLDE